MLRLFCLAFIWIGGCGNADGVPPNADASTKEAEAELRQALRDQPRLAKVHAAEALLELNRGQDVATVFRQEQDLHVEQPHYRIHIWRVLARAAATPAERQQYVDQIVRIYLDPQSPDAATAAESLAKIEYPIPPDDRPQHESLASTATGEELAYRRWVLAVSGTADDVQRLAALLNNRDVSTRRGAAYALRHLGGNLPPAVVEVLEEAAESAGPGLDRTYMLSAAFVVAREANPSERFRRLLMPLAQEGSDGEKYEAAQALAERGRPDDIPVLLRLLKDPAPDVRVSAARALLRIDRRRLLPFQPIDWVVLAAYGAGMLGIGWYFSRRTSSTDDYLLAGRSMRPWAVGLSYFATMNSTISYLSAPGEMIRHGPMIFGSLLAYPFIYLFVTRLLIPSFMGLTATSAYEILERRLGLSVRMLGSAFFMTLRLLWMAFIIYTTSRYVLVPLLQLDPAATPWIGAAMGLLTMTYTSMGGLRAVIWTDVAQTIIMFFGAFLCIALITVSMGGVGAWWPTSWAPEWEPLQLYNSSARVTVSSAMIAFFCWAVSTAGSDQMAIQRYLSLRDARAARRMFGMATGSDVLITVLLAILGLALFAYFRANPQMLPDGQTLDVAADQLLPRYIVRGLPAGITGLVIAALLSAAMSSLSSGLSSSSLVITGDWIDRFRGAPANEAAQVRSARAVSWALGIVIVALSFLATLVHGNLLERGYRMINLLTGPLFVLFFMAIFVRWATPLGAWTGGLASVAAASLIAYTDVTGLGFLWMIPAALVTGIVAGCLVSLLPFGTRRPMLQPHASSNRRN